MNVRQTTFLAIFFLCPILASPAFCQQNVNFPDFQKNYQKYLNKTVKTEAKYGVCWGGHYIVMCKSMTKFYLQRSDKKLIKQLNNNFDNFGNKLKERESNIEVVAQVVKNLGQFSVSSQQNVVIKLVSVKKLLDDLPRFEAQLSQELKATNDVIKAHYKVAAKAHRWASQYESAKAAKWARETYRKALTKTTKTLKIDAVQDWIKLGEAYISLVNDRKAAIAALNHPYQNLSQQPKNQAKLTELAHFLRKLGASYYKKSWLPKAEYRRIEGFVRAPKTNQWIRQDWLEFQVVVATDEKRQIDFLTEPDSVYKKNAAIGQIVKFMRPFHVVELKTKKSKLGLPKVTNHLTRNIAGEVRKYTQWIMPDKSRFYFANGRLFHWFSSSDEYLTH